MRETAALAISPESASDSLPSITITTINVHKGLTGLNTKLVLQQQRDLIRSLDSDIVFLQEVCGAHSRHHKFSTQKHYEYLADSIWPNYAYGQNAVTVNGHHGNALLSKFPIIRWENQDISASQIEQRGILHGEIAIPGWDHHLHCMCVHLGLLSRWRGKQINALNNRIHHHVPAQAPLIIAGDFNDWRQTASQQLAEHQHLKEVFKLVHGAYARSFPSSLPLFKLDRVYVRGFHVVDCNVFGHTSSTRISDHAALTARLSRVHA